MAEETNPMVEAGRATGDHPFEERYTLERRIQLEGSKDPENFKLGNRTLADIQKANQQRQEKEGEAQTKSFRESMREQSTLAVSAGEKVVMNEQGILLDATEPKLADGVEVDESHQVARNADQSVDTETKQGPDTTQTSTGAGGQTGAGSTGPGGINTSGTSGGTGTTGGSSTGGTS